MPCRAILAILLVLGSTGLALAESPPEVKRSPKRWWTTRQVIAANAEAAGFRWAMPDTISRRAFGETLGVEELCQQTGLKIAKMGRTLVFHEPNEAAIQQWTQKLEQPDRRAKLPALAELGWAHDVLAWPLLARIAAGDDVELALAAAQGLRRMEGDKGLDWRQHGVSSEDPALPPMQEPIAAWQTPLGAAYPQEIELDAIRRMAQSRYFPIREAAVRLAACQPDGGQAIVEKLTRDASPLVRASAQQNLAAWAKPVVVPPKVVKSDGSPPTWDQQPAPDLKAAAEELAKNKDHDSVWRLVGRRVAFQGTPEAIAVMLEYGKSGGRWSGFVGRPLAEWCGGPEAIAWLRLAAREGTGDYDGRQAWGLWGLSALEDGPRLAESLTPVLAGKSYWASPPEYTAAARAGIHSLKPLLARLETRGHWACLALGHVGGPEATEALIARLGDKDPGVAVAAAKGLGDTARALAGVKPLIAQLEHPDRLRRHWAVLGLGRIGGPDAAAALQQVLVVEEKRQDRLVRKAAAEILKEIGPLSTEAAALITRFEAEDKLLVPEYRPRNARFDASFPANTEVVIQEHRPKSYSSIGETRAAMDWANRLLLRYGGCSPCYSNECFAFDVGTGTWFPIRAADQYCHLFAETRPNPGCSRGLAFDGIHKLFWIGGGIGGNSGPSQSTHNLSNALSAYDAALDRFLPASAPAMAKSYSGEPAKLFTFDYDTGLVVSSNSGADGVGLLDADQRRTFTEKGPLAMPRWEQYRPPAFAYDAIGQRVLCTHPELGWKLLSYDRQGNAFALSESLVPGSPSKQILGGLVYDSLNRQMILVGGISKETGTMPTCRYDRAKMAWVDLEVKNLGKMGVGQGSCVFDPEHNVILEPISGAAYRFQPTEVGVRAYYGGGIGKK